MQSATLTFRRLGARKDHSLVLKMFLRDSLISVRSFRTKKTGCGSWIMVDSQGISRKFMQSTNKYRSTFLTRATPVKMDHASMKIWNCTRTRAQFTTLKWSTGIERSLSRSTTNSRKSRRSGTSRAALRANSITSSLQKLKGEKVGRCWMILGWWTQRQSTTTHNPKNCWRKNHLKSLGPFVQTSGRRTEEGSLTESTQKSNLRSRRGSTSCSSIIRLNQRIF